MEDSFLSAKLSLFHLSPQAFTLMIILEFGASKVPFIGDIRLYHANFMIKEGALLLSGIIKSSTQTVSIFVGPVSQEMYLLV